MKSQVLRDEQERTWVLVFDIGAFQEVVLRYFHWETKAYEEIPINEQVEVLTVAGNLSREEGEPRVHPCLIVGRRDGTTRGGHLKEARVRPTLELILTEEPQHLCRQARRRDRSRPVEARGRSYQRRMRTRTLSGRRSSTSLGERLVQGAMRGLKAGRRKIDARRGSVRTLGHVLRSAAAGALSSATDETLAPPPRHSLLEAAWSEIGFGGPASPRGNVRLGCDQRDPWVARKIDPERERADHE